VLLQNAGHIATIHARPNSPKYANEQLLSEESPCGIFDGLSGTRQIFILVIRVAPLSIIPSLLYTCFNQLPSSLANISNLRQKIEHCKHT
jgi:hypothetical protein